MLDVFRCLQRRYLYTFDNQINKMHIEEKDLEIKYVFIPFDVFRNLVPLWPSCTEVMPQLRCKEFVCAIKYLTSSHYFLFIK